MELGIRVVVVGEVVPYSFSSQDSGETISGVNLRVPGDVVGVTVDEGLSKRMREGEIWQVEGPGVVSKKKGQLRINRPEVLRRLKESASATGPKVDFGDKLPSSKVPA